MSELDTKYQSRRLEKRLKERFVKAMATYHLIEDDDRILVGLSGGKDSLLLLELLAKRAKILHPRFEVEALHVRMENIHYETDTSYLQSFCDELGVPLHIRTTRFEVFNEETENINLKPQSSNLKPQTSARPKDACYQRDARNLKSQTLTNHSGGIQGGISNGQDIYFRVAFKPVATLLRSQETIDLEGNPTTFTARGRHDPCVLPRAVPVVEAMAAMVVLDSFLCHQAYKKD